MVPDNFPVVVLFQEQGIIIQFIPILAAGGIDCNEFMIIVKPDMGVVKTSGALGAGIFPLSASIEYNSFDLRIFTKEAFEIIHLFVSDIPVCACPPFAGSQHVPYSHSLSQYVARVKFTKI